MTAARRLVVMAVFSAFFLRDALADSSLFVTGQPTRKPFIRWAVGYGALADNLRSVAVYVSIADGRRIRSGNRAVISLFPQPEKTIEVPGTVSGVMSDADPNTGQAIVHIAIPEQSGPAHIYTNVRIATDERLAWSVPTNAVIWVNGSPLVYRKTGENQFSPVTVTLGQQRPDITEIRSGLNPEDTILVQGALEWANKDNAGAE